jgi:hypothetical protein
MGKKAQKRRLDRAKQREGRSLEPARVAPKPPEATGDKAGIKTFLLRNRYMVAALVVLATAGTARIACDSDEVRKDETHKSSKLQKTERPPGSTNEDEVIWTPPKTKKSSTPGDSVKRGYEAYSREYDPEDFETTESIGSFEFVFHNDFTEAEIGRLTNLWSKVFSIIGEKYIPIPEDLGKQIFATKSPPGVSSMSSYGEGKIAVDMGATDGILIHELVHILHGPRDTKVNFLEEGLATAISNLVCEETGFESWDKLKNVQVNEVLRDGGVSQLSFVPYDFYPPMLHIRYYFSGKLWQDIEEEHPGAIHKLHVAYYKFLDEGGDENELFDKKLLDIIRSAGLSSAFDKIAPSNPVMRFDASAGQRDLVYLYYGRFTGNQRQGSKANDMVYGFLVNKSNNGSEKGYPGRPFYFRVKNLDTGRISQNLLVKADDQGHFKINVEALKQEAGDAQRYELFYTAPGEESQKSFAFNVE